MRIALFTDVHANLPALEAVLDDIEKRNVETIFCLGDLVSYAPWPNEVIDIVKKNRIATIAGNHDEILGNKSHNGLDYKGDRNLSIGQQSIEYTNSILTVQNRLYLKSLPRQIKLEFHSCKFLLCHGSPEKIDEYLTKDLSHEFYWQMMEKHEADVMAFGHTHKPFHKTIEKGKQTKHAINLGSVGKPKDGDPKACYVIVELEDKVAVEFIRVDYDIEKAAKAVEDSPLPNQFADMLRKAY
jgi:putative phosphoesterase